jgi:hypothetical protein
LVFLEREGPEAIKKTYIDYKTGYAILRYLNSKEI